MSLHPSLKIGLAGAQQRSVMSRIERIKDLMKKDLWKDEQSVVGLPKTKIVRLKAKKAVKEAKPAEGEAAAGTEAKAAAPAAKKEAKK